MSPGSSPPTENTAPEARQAGAFDPSWSLWQALLLVLFFILVQAGSVLLIARAVNIFYPGPVNPADIEHIILRLEIPLSILISHSLTWLAVYFLIVRWSGLPFTRALGLETIHWPVCGKAFVGGIFLQMVSLAIILYFPPPPGFVSPLERFFQQGSWAILVLFLVAVLMAPPLEEVLFRGVLYPPTRKKFSPMIAVLATTVLFSALHASQSMGYWPPLAGIFLCGLLLALLREKTQSLWPPIAFHAGFNITPFLTHFLFNTA